MGPSTGECLYLISEGAETTGTTQGRVPSNQECAHPPRRVHTSSRRDLRLQAPPGAGCPSTGECSHLIPEGAEATGITWGRVPSEWEYLHLISEATETTGTRESANQGRLCTHTHSPEKAYHKKRVGTSWEHQDSSWKRKPTAKGITNR